MVRWLALLLLVPVHAFGQTVTFDLDESRATELGLDPQALEGSLADQVEVDLQLVDPDGYLDAFARSAAIATKGIGVDYASNPELFSVGVAFGSAVAGVPLTFTYGEDELPKGGFAFMAALHAGINLGAFTPGDENVLDRVRIYASGLGFRTPVDREFSGRMWNFGAHVQVALIEPAKAATGVAEWGGLALTAGYEHSVYALELSRALPISTDLEGARITWQAEGTYTIETAADAVPLELSTSFRLLAFTLYGGGALDLDVAHATSAVSLEGPVNVTVGGTTEPLGTGSVGLESRGEAPTSGGRGFFGLQLSVFAFKVYGQVNVAADQTYGGFAGVRVAM